MLTSFFGKSSSLKFLLIGGYIFVLGILRFFYESSKPISGVKIGVALASICLLILSTFLLDFIIKKNNLNQNNAYGVFLFSCMAMMLPALLAHPKVVIANLFILLALRRIFSLKSIKNNERKMLDAALWIGIASAFYFWSIFLIFALYVAIYLKSNRRFRYFLIPIATWVGIFLIATAALFLIQDSFKWFLTWLGDASFDFSAYSPVGIIVFITFISVMVVWTIISKVANISAKSKKDRPYQYLIIYILIICVLISLLSSEKSGAEFLFFLAPAAIVISAYFEKKSEIWFKEILLWIFALLPFVFLLL